MAPVTSLSSRSSNSSNTSSAGLAKRAAYQIQVSEAHTGAADSTPPLNHHSDSLDQTPRQPHPQSSRSLTFLNLNPPLQAPENKLLYCCASLTQHPAAPSPCSPPPQLVALLVLSLAVVGPRRQTSNQTSRIRGTDGAASKPRALSPCTNMAGSGLPALSSAPHRHATPCVWFGGLHVWAWRRRSL